MLRASLFVIFLLSTLPRGAAASSVSCPGGIVSSGDSVVDLVVKCGQPEWKESHQEKITERVEPGLKRRTYITVEEWTYNFGPQQLLRMVTIRNGIISDIRTGQYGTAKDREPAGPGCDGLGISTGETTADVLRECGEPFYRTSREEVLREQLDDTRSRKVIVTVEEWTYNFGPQRFMRIITLRNGVVVDVRTGGYGQ